MLQLYGCKGVIAIDSIVGDTTLKGSLKSELVDSAVASLDFCVLFMHVTRTCC